MPLQNVYICLPSPNKISSVITFPQQNYCTNIEWLTNNRSIYTKPALVFPPNYERQTLNLYMYIRPKPPAYNTLVRVIKSDWLIGLLCLHNVKFDWLIVGYQTITSIKLFGGPRHTLSALPVSLLELMVQVSTVFLWYVHPSNNWMLDIFGDGRAYVVQLFYHLFWPVWSGRLIHADWRNRLSAKHVWFVHVPGHVQLRVRLLILSLGAISVGHLAKLFTRFLERLRKRRVHHHSAIDSLEHSSRVVNSVFFYIVVD